MISHGRGEEVVRSPEMIGEGIMGSSTHVSRPALRKGKAECQRRDEGAFRLTLSKGKKTRLHAKQPNKGQRDQLPLVSYER